jgi:hypothetical protein
MLRHEQQEAVMCARVIDYTTTAFAFASVACGPAVIWIAVWMVAR